MDLHHKGGVTEEIVKRVLVGTPLHKRKLIMRGGVSLYRIMFSRSQSAGQTFFLFSFHFPTIRCH